MFFITRGHGDATTFERATLPDCAQLGIWKGQDRAFLICGELGVQETIDTGVGITEFNDQSHADETPFESISIHEYHHGRFRQLVSLSVGHGVEYLTDFRTVTSIW
jgi:hypothetical protein